MAEIGRLDAFQRRHPVVGFPLAVVYKYFDDQGPYLAATIAYYAFVAIFPLLLISSSILGFVLQGDPGLADRVLDSALGQFPIIGDQLGRPEGLTGSRGAIVVGSITALYGSLGLGQSTQNASNIVWSVPRNSRANPILMRLKSLVFLAIAGLGILLVAIVSSVLANTGAFGADLPLVLDRFARVLGLALTIGVFMVLFRVIGRRGTWRARFAGATVTAVLWQLLQAGGRAYVEGVINQADAMNATFALVLGLIGYIFIAAAMVVIGLEVMVVTSRRLWPRALLTPFTDNVVLTEADRRAYTGYAKSQRHKGFQTVDVHFDDTAGGADH